MPIGLPIQQLPNQSFTITLDGNLYEITLKTCNGITAVSITENGTDILDNGIAASCAQIISSQYNEAGNFMFLTANQQLPNYAQFGLTQSLFYFSASELAAFRIPPAAVAPTAPTVTAAFFNPIAGLPLRFAPQGYVQAT